MNEYKFGRDTYTYDYEQRRENKNSAYIPIAPPQHQNYVVGLENIMEPRPIFDNPNYKGSNKLKDKVIILTGGDSGLGRAAAVAYAKEGANLVIPYYNEHEDAKETKRIVEKYGAKCVILSGDLSQKEFCKAVVSKTLETFGKIDVLVNNAGVQYQQDKIEDISDEQFDWTMRVNIYGMFYLTRECVPYLKSGSSIINLTSVTTFKGDPQLIDYVTTKGAIVGFTRALARNLALKNIRVNAIAPGFFWTPLQPNCWVAKKVPTLGADAAFGRGAMPYELAPTYVFLASDDSSYMTGAVVHVNGGEVMA